MAMDDDREMLAGEYALGTLDASERVAAERLIASDAAFAERVRYWENRLAALADAVEPVEPPSALWPRILAALPLGGGAQVIDLTRRLKRWQGAAYVAGALAASLLVFIGVREVYQSRLPQGGKFVAVLQQDKVSPGFLLTVDLRTKEFTVRRVGAEAPRDRSFELWLVHDIFPTPRSLGVIGDHEFTRAALSAYDPKIINEATYAVSVEPPGGSPTGVATGPVVYIGKLIEAVP
ncbi:MAG: anti-sigma factor [Pseudorhodoplanes sp.]